MEQEQLTVRLAEADTFYARGRMDEALAAYQSIIAEDDTVAWAHSRVGGIMAQRGNLEAAEQALNRALELDPELPQAHSNLGNIHYTRGQYEQAVACYKEAARLDPDNPIYYENQHAAFKKMKRLSDAVAVLKRAHKLSRQAKQSPGEAGKESTGGDSLGPRRRLGCLPGAAGVLLLTLLATVVAGLA